MLVLTRLETAPTWVQSVALGLAFGALWVLSQRLLLSHDWGEAFVSGVLASALYGAVVGPLTAKKRRLARTEAGLDALPVHQQRTALRAARGGPAPTDPAARHAALRLAAQRRDRIHAQRVLATTILVAATAASALAALASSPWWWASAAIFAGLLASQLTETRRLHHRITLLEATSNWGNANAGPTKTLSVPRAWYAVVVFGEIRWAEDSETHIARHKHHPLRSRASPLHPPPPRGPRAGEHHRSPRHHHRRPTPAGGHHRSRRRPRLHHHRPRHEPHRETHVPREGTLTMDQTKIDELRHHYDTTDVAEHFTDATLDTRTTDDILVSTSIRLPQSLVNQVREQAAALGVPATTLMRQWVTEKASTPQSPAVVTVADLQRFIAEQAHPLAS